MPEVLDILGVGSNIIRLLEESQVAANIQVPVPDWTGRAKHHVLGVDLLETDVAVRTLVPNLICFVDDYTFKDTT